MKIPVYIDDKCEGELAVDRQGTVTIFDARLRDVGRLVRLCVFGDGEGYLGVPAPDRDGTMRLVRRLTPSQMRGFPSKPEYAAERRRERREPESVPESGAESRRHVLWQGGRPYYF